MANAKNSAQAEIQNLNERLNITRLELEEERRDLSENMPQAQQQIHELQQRQDELDSQIRQSKNVAKQLKRDIKLLKGSVLNSPVSEANRAKKLEQMQHEVSWRVQKLNTIGQQIEHALNEQDKLRYQVELLRFKIQASEDNLPLENDPRIVAISQELHRARHNLQSIK